MEGPNALIDDLFNNTHVLHSTATNETEVMSDEVMYRGLADRYG